MTTNTKAKSYIEAAYDFFVNGIITPHDRSGQYFIKFIQSGIASPLIENLEAREALLTGKPVNKNYSALLKIYMDRSGQFLKHMTEAFPDDDNLLYLQTAYKVISYKTLIDTGKRTRKPVIHPALFPFIDTVEALRRAAFLSMCIIWTGRGNTIFFSREPERKYQSKDIISMKVVDPFLLSPNFSELRDSLSPHYSKFKEDYSNGAEQAAQISIKALNDLQDWTDEPQRKEIINAIKEVSQQIKRSFPPTPEAFAEGFSFFSSRVIEHLEKLHMDCRRGTAYIVPLFKNNLHPYYSYTEQQQQAYLQKLEELEPQRDRNVITLLQEADLEDQGDRIILPAFLFFYRALKETLPPDKAMKALEAAANEININVKKADKINYPVDNVNNDFWGTVERNANGQIAFSTLKRGTKKAVTILTAINFMTMDDVKITKKLNRFDKRVYIVVANLFNAGNPYVTLTQIHYAMGNTSKPSKKQLEKINDSVSKMKTAVLYLDNTPEIEKYKYKYKKVHYDGALLPIERIVITVKGQLSDAAIHIFREPPLMTFARERDQITTFEAKLLQSPVNKTDDTLAIEDFLLESIATTKNAATNKDKKAVVNVIKYETICQNAGITGRMQKARAIEKVKKLFEYYTKCGYLTGYKPEPDRIIFYFEVENKKKELLFPKQKNGKA